MKKEKSLPRLDMAADGTSRIDPGDAKVDELEEKKLSSRSEGAIDGEVKRQLVVISLSQLMLNLGFSQIVPVLPMFAAEMGGHLGATGVGMVIAAPSAARIILNIPLGRLADTIGRKPLMWAGTALTATGTVATALRPRFTRCFRSAF